MRLGSPATTCLNAWDEQWHEVVRALDPRYLALPDLRDFDPDYGVHALRSGVRSDTELLFLGYSLQMVVGLENKLYTAVPRVQIANRPYLTSFDLSEALLGEIFESYIRKFRQADSSRASESAGTSRS